MGFAGYVSAWVQLYCILVFDCLSLHVSTFMAIFKYVAVIYVGFHCLSLHVSACMAIFKCVGVILVLCRFHCLSLHVSAYMAIFRCVGVIYVGFHCLSLHVSAYMAIFRCVGFIVCWFPPSFTTCFGLHDHLQVCRSYCMLISTVFHYMFRPTWPSSGA
jgi:hypothetical protein